MPHAPDRIAERVDPHRHVQELLGRADVRAAIEPALSMTKRDPVAIAGAIAPPLTALGSETSALRRPVVVAALALLIARRQP